MTGPGWREMLRQGRAMRRGGELSRGQVLMAANTPVLLRAAMVDGRPDLGLMSSGQVAGLFGGRGVIGMPGADGLLEQGPGRLV